MFDSIFAFILATAFIPRSSPRTAMPMILSLAETQMKMSPAEAISAATINAAASLSRDSEIGSLDPDKRADFLICDCHDYRELAYWFGFLLVRDVFVAGKQVTNFAG